MVRGAVLGLAALCAGCAGNGYRSSSGWDGRRGYDGNGDYGYDVAASQAEARDYRALAESRHYPEPGTPDDPWGPYIQGAAARFQVPERWVREVMRQESGGHLYDSNGLLITSSAGAGAGAPPRYRAGSATNLLRQPAQQKWYCVPPRSQ